MSATPHVSALIQASHHPPSYPRSIPYDSVCMPAIPPRSSKRPKPPELAKCRNKLQKRRRPSDGQNTSSQVGVLFDDRVRDHGLYSNQTRSTLSGFWSFRSISKGGKRHTFSNDEMGHSRMHSGSITSNMTSSQDLERMWQQIPDVASRYSASSNDGTPTSPSLSAPSSTFDHAGWHSDSTDASSIYSSECTSGRCEGNADMKDIVVSAELIAEQYRNLLLSRASTRASMRTPLPPAPTPDFRQPRIYRPLRPHAPAPKLRRRPSLPNLRRLTLIDTEVALLSSHVSQLTSSLTSTRKMSSASARQVESSIQMGQLIEAYEDLQRELQLSNALDESDAEEMQALNGAVDEWLEAVGMAGCGVNSA
ncbi:MAG: hypothetical protein M1818_004757 [Claussenomyces sp. TS43310]|nr:MAG: hypothetical protein M1818_004757 [Claussenomyces sp. TS43310]